MSLRDPGEKEDGIYYHIINRLYLADI